MNPLLTEPEATVRTESGPGDPAGPGGPGSSGDAPGPDARSCDACGAPMAAEQDWCLECGTAAPGRLGERHGWRAIVTVVAATLLLATGAVAAGYAALGEDANIDAAQPAPPPAGPVAQAPPALPPASVPPTATPPAAPVPTPPAPGATAPGATPPVPPAPGATPAPPPGAATPLPTTPAPGATPAPATPAPSTGGSTDSGSSDEGSPGDAGSGSGSGSGSGDAARTEVEIPKGGVKIYDPYGRATVKGDPKTAHDGSRDTVFRLGTETPGEAMGVGVVIDLGEPTAVSAIEVLSDTPGYRLETYGATEEVLPPDILDARWEHFRDIGSFDRNEKDGNTPGDAVDRLSLGGEKKIRRLALWITTPPERSPLVRISEIRLFR